MRASITPSFSIKKIFQIPVGLLNNEKLEREAFANSFC
jgi:hypothetical protein